VGIDANLIGKIPEKCRACSVLLPLQRPCQRTFCDNKVEKMGSITAEMKTSVEGHWGPEPDIMNDSGDEFLKMLAPIAADDAEGLRRAQQSYGNSWKSRGGVGAFMMLARKWDRLENRVKKSSALGGEYDIFAHIASDERSEGIIDDVRDLRRYLLLVEAEMVARGFDAQHRDNN